MEKTIWTTNPRKTYNAEARKARIAWCRSDTKGVKCEIHGGMSKGIFTALVGKMNGHA